MKTPFYIGQTVDNVLQVAKKTNRKHLALEFTTEDGETYRFDLDAPTAKKRNEKLDAMAAELGEKSISLGHIPQVKYFYPDCTLTFERRMGPYRIIRIEVSDV